MFQAVTVLSHGSFRSFLEELLAEPLDEEVQDHVEVGDGGGACFGKQEAELVLADRLDVEGGLLALPLITEHLVLLDSSLVASAEVAPATLMIGDALHLVDLPLVGVELPLGVSHVVAVGEAAGVLLMSLHVLLEVCLPPSPVGAALVVTLLDSLLLLVLLRPLAGLEVADLVAGGDTEATDGAVKPVMLPFMIMILSHADNIFSTVGAGELSLVMAYPLVPRKRLLCEEFLTALLANNDVIFLDFDFIFIKLHAQQPI